MLPLVEKYRPQKIADCILPKGIKSTFEGIVQTGEIPNMILAGGAGCGKTTVARAMCSELGADYMFINASEEGGIDTLRTKVRNFASTVSLGGSKKVIILDEADYLNPQSTQPALRGAIEEFAANCRFVMTCNYKARIIEPLHSRCTVVDFKIPVKEKPQLAGEFLERAKHIMETEGIEYEEKAVAELIIRYFPDFRKVLNTIQRHSLSGAINSSILCNGKDIDIDQLIKAMKNKSFADIRKWVTEHSDTESSFIFRKIYDGLQDKINSSSIPQAILILGEYQYKAAFVADQEINLVACCLMLASDCSFDK
jgi:DNA polymerase III delta prime subunit